MISVIVPVYNVEKYLDKCIESIINQTYTELEIILVDDGSTDNSGMICDKWAQCDERIKVFHKENGGLSDARNYGIERVSGEYIGFVDSDDYIHSHMYEILYANLQDNNADMSSCKLKNVYEDIYCDAFAKIALENQGISIYNRDSAMNHLVEVGISACNKLYKRELLDNIRFPYRKLHEDEFIFHELVYRCKKIAVSNLELYYYVQRRNSIMSELTPQRLQDAMEAYENRLKFIQDNEWRNVYETSLRLYMYYMIKQYYRIKKAKVRNQKEWQKKLLTRVRELRNSCGIESVMYDFRIFCNHTWAYLMYNRLSQIKNKKSKK